MEESACSVRYIVLYQSPINRRFVLELGAASEVIGIHSTDQDALYHARIEEERWAAYGPLYAVASGEIGGLKRDGSQAFSVGGQRNRTGTEFEGHLTEDFAAPAVQRRDICVFTECRDLIDIG